MNPADAAERLRALATRVRRNVPVAGDPERFHLELSEIARGLVDIAGGLDEGAPRQGRCQRQEADPTRGSQDTGKPTARGRPVLTTTVIAGRRVAVQRRRPSFAIFVGS